MPANVETMAYNAARGVPWHGLGTPMAGLMTMEEAYEASGLNWNVIKVPVYVNGEVVPDKVANVRESDGKYLAITGNRYRIIQNHEEFELAYAIVAEKPEAAIVDTAISLNGGCDVIVNLDLTAVAPIKIGNDQFQTFLLLANAHDGTKPQRGIITPVRGVCQNTVNLAFAGKGPSFTIRHSGDIESKLAAVREALQLTIDYAARFEEVATAAMKQTVTDKRAENVLRKVFGMSKKVADNPESAWFINHAATRTMGIYQSATDLAPYRGSAWGLVNAVAEFVDHDRTYGKGAAKEALDIKATQILWGSGYEAINRTLALVAPKLANARVARKAATLGSSN